MKILFDSHFARALRAVRRAVGATQEDFGDVSSRVYVSALERGVKQPTLPKVDELAKVLDVHPLTLLTLSYCARPTAQESARVLARVQAEIGTMQLERFG